MSEGSLSTELKKSAIGLGLCKQWQEEWKDDTDKQALIEKYFKGLDFPMKHHWPSNKFIKENFERDLLRKNNILVDDMRSLLNPTEAVILGNSESKIRVNGNNHSVLYIRDNASVEIYAKNKAFVIVHAFEKAHIVVTVNDDPNVLILKHSETTEVYAPNSVKIKKEIDYLE